MPIGSFAVIPFVAAALTEIHPRRVLDVGIGDGFYGAVVRRYCDAGDIRAWHNGKGVDLVGVEAFGAYRNPCWSLYNYIYEIDLVTLVQDWEARHSKVCFDFIIFGDCIEHFEKEQGEWVLQKLMDRLTSPGRLMVSTPAIWCEQGAVGGNEFERHRSLWTKRDFTERGFAISLDGTPTVAGFGHQMLVAQYQK